MDLKKKASKSIAIALVGVSVVTPILNSVSAMEPIKEIQNIEVKDGYKPMSLIKEDVQGETIKIYDQETRLGGGPSPSAAWTYNKSYSRTFSHSQLLKLSGKYQGVMNSSGYKRGKIAYDASVIALGYMGLGVGGSVASTVISSFGKTYHSEIQRSANIISNAASKKKSVTLKVKEYIRPATGAKLVLFY